jgi:hypothetical protein
MPVDPMIARGVEPLTFGNTLMQIGALKQRDRSLDQDAQYQNALMQDRQQLRQREQQQFASEQEREAMAEQLAGQVDEAFAAGGWDAALPLVAQWGRIDPDNAKLYKELREPKADKLPGSYQEYQLAQKDPAYASHLEGSRPKPTSVNLSVNTAEDFYSSLAKDQAAKFSALAEAAQAAPASIERTERILSLLEKTPYTGAGAEFKLALGKGAKALGFDYAGDDIANTEALYAELASTTLDSIKTSGLGSGQGFTDNDRKFLERAKAGQITMDPAALRRLALLNKKANIATINQYNERSKRLKSDQLDVMGMPGSIQPGSDLTPEEAKELEALRAQFGQGQR